ncbi:apelin receptor A-like [Pristis pectinata]|uniref:apelin receptor A-like n=1 Tax=Pristis pectinata TaxID=685728 RepID=UPI00223D7A39|nr:apelin receptor A-like [Pristis pectinata]
MTTSTEVTAWNDYQTYYSELFCDFDQQSYMKIFIVLIYCLVFIVGTFGNLLVIIIMRLKKRSKRLVDVFITHLAVADLAFLITLPLWAVSTALDQYWHFGEFLCKLSSFIVTVNMYSSIFFLTCLSIDRFIAIVLSLDYGHLRTRRHATVGSLVIWALSLTLGVPTLLYKKLVQDEGRWTCSGTITPFSNSFTLAIRFIAFVLPLCIITVCYCSVAVKLHKHFGRMRKEERNNWKSVRIGFWIITMFVLAWLPYNVFKTVDALVWSSTLQLSCHMQEVVRRGTMVLTCLAFFNSCVNPIIYLIYDRYFRESFFQLLPFLGFRRPEGSSSTPPAQWSRSQRHNSSLSVIKVSS